MHVPRGDENVEGLSKGDGFVEPSDAGCLGVPVRTVTCALCHDDWRRRVPVVSDELNKWNGPVGDERIVHIWIAVNDEERRRRVDLNQVCSHTLLHKAVPAKSKISSNGGNSFVCGRLDEFVY